MSTPVAFLVKLSWPDGPEFNNDTPEQTAAIKEAIECLCGVESVEDLLDVGEKPDAVTAFENLRKVVGTAFSDKGRLTPLTYPTE